MALKDLFSYKPMQILAEALNTYNTATQTLAIKGSSDTDLKTTGTAEAIINGLPVTVAAQATIDLSDEDVCDVAGVTYTSVTLWLLVTTTGGATGALVWYAGTGTTPVVPDYSPETNCAIGLVKVVCGAGGYTVGTTGWDDADAVETIIQIVGPLVPHYSKI